MSIECITLIFEAISFNLLSFNFLLCISLFSIFCCIMVQNKPRHTRNFRTYCARKSHYECKRCAISRAVSCQNSCGCLASIAAKQRNNRAGKELRRIQNANRQSDANNTSAAVAANAAVAVAAADLKLSCGLGCVSGRCL